jgi:histidine triad (HIT) family protein
VKTTGGSGTVGEKGVKGEWYFANRLALYNAVMAETLFTKIIARQIPANIAFEDADYIAIHDLHPQAPVHLLLIPKKPIASLNDVTPEDGPLIGGLFPLAARLMKQMGHGDFRTVFNCGSGAGQTVFHLHLHVLAGRKFDWPPG